MARENIKFTTKKRILAEEFVEHQDVEFEMCEGYTITGKELIETGIESENITMTDDVITCTEFCEAPVSININASGGATLTFSRGSKTYTEDQDTNSLIQYNLESYRFIISKNNTGPFIEGSITMPTATVTTSYTYDGWYINGVKQTGSISGSVDGNTSLNLKLAVKAETRKYNITYSYKTATGLTTSIVKQIPYGESVTANAPAVPARTDIGADGAAYSFSNWSYSSSTVTGNQTVTAIYSVSYFDYSKLATFKPVISFNTSTKEIKITNISELGKFVKGQLMVGLIKKKNVTRKSTSNSHYKEASIGSYGNLAAPPRSLYREGSMFSYYNRISNNHSYFDIFDGYLWAPIGPDGIVDSEIYNTFYNYASNGYGESYGEGYFGADHEHSYLYTGFYVYAPTHKKSGSNGMWNEGSRSLRSSNCIRWTNSATPVASLSNSYFYNDGSISMFHSVKCENPSSSSYTFVNGETQYFTSNNNGKANSYAYAKISFYVPVKSTVSFECYQSSESNGTSCYDYGSISKLDSTLSMSTSDDTTNSQKIFRVASNSSNGYTETIDYNNVQRGWHFITVKYRKDSSANTGSDIFRINSITRTATIEDNI